MKKSQMVINHIVIELEKKRIKNMYLKVLPPDARVVITAPVRMSDEEINRFVLTKTDWIRQQQEKLRKRQIQPELDYTMGDEIYIWGKKYILHVNEKSGKSLLQIEEEKIFLFVKPGSTREQKKRILDHWYKEELTREIPGLIAKWESIIGVKSSDFRIRDMKTRWGTCNIRSKVICLSLQLAKKTPRCLEYVVVHELVHLLEASHNRVFKGYLDQFLPEWRNIKKEMNGSL